MQYAADIEKPATAANHPNPPRLVFLSAPYRRIHAPLLQPINEVKDENRGWTIAVLIRELVKCQRGRGTRQGADRAWLSVCAALGASRRGGEPHAPYAIH